ncbi:putative phosphoglycerate mutase [Corynebacterium xerosis]|nr:putative phosphoglycerate mutase [Corynebacterium xerosis]
MTALAERLRAEPMQSLLHGPRRRARQSAEILGEAVGLDPEPTELLEDLTPHPSPEHWDDYSRGRWDWLHETPVEERDEDAVSLDAAWARLTKRAESGAHEQSKTLICVTHAFVIGSFVRNVLGAPADAWLRLPVANAGLTDLRRRPSGEWAVHSMSDVGHLVGLAGTSS